MRLLTGYAVCRGVTCRLLSTVGRLLPGRLGCGLTRGRTRACTGLPCRSLARQLRGWERCRGDFRLRGMRWQLDSRPAPLMDGSLGRCLGCAASLGCSLCCCWGGLAGWICCPLPTAGRLGGGCGCMLLLLLPGRLLLGLWRCKVHLGLGRGKRGVRIQSAVSSSLSLLPCLHADRHQSIAQYRFATPSSQASHIASESHCNVPHGGQPSPSACLLL